MHCVWGRVDLSVREEKDWAVSGESPLHAGVERRVNAQTERWMGGMGRGQRRKKVRKGAEGRHSRL